MKQSIQEVVGVIFDEDITFTTEEICQHCSIEIEVVTEMIDVGIIEPIDTERQWIFDARAMQRSQSALRLKRDLGVNLEGAALILDLLDEINLLREKVNRLEGKD